MNAMQFFEGLTTYNSLFILSALGLAYLLGIFSMQGYMMVLRQKMSNRKKEIASLKEDLQIVRSEYLEMKQPGRVDLLDEEDANDNRAKFLHKEFNNFKDDFQDSIEFYVHSIDELSETNHQLLKKVKALQIENEHLIKTVWSDESSLESFKQDVQNQELSINDIQLAVEEEVVIEEESVVASKVLKHWIAAFPESTDQDELSKIKGISKKLEARINELGILGFEQLSLLDDTMIDDLAKAIDYYAGRIRREDWVGQAREFKK